MNPLEKLWGAGHVRSRPSRGSDERVYGGSVDPIEASRALIGTIRGIGEKYGRFEVFLAELLMAAEAMKAGMAVLQPHLANCLTG